MSACVCSHFALFMHRDAVAREQMLVADACLGLAPATYFPDRACAWPPRSGPDIVSTGASVKTALPRPLRCAPGVLTLYGQSPGGLRAPKGLCETPTGVCDRISRAFPPLRNVRTGTPGGSRP